MKGAYDVVLAGYYGFGNLGDELLAQSLIQLLVSSGVERERIAVLSNAPAESEKKFGVRALDRWSLPAVREALLASRTLLLGGGGLFQDATSLRSCVYYWGLVRLARMSRCRVWAVGQSVGPLLSPSAKWMARTAFAACEYIGVRDEGSREFLSRFGLGCELSPDLTFALEIPVLPERGRTVLVNIRPTRKGRWGDRVAQLACKLRDKGFPLRYVAFAQEDVSEMERCFAARGLSLRDIVTPGSLDDFLEISGDAFAAVGMRLHFGVLSLRRGLSVALAPYDPKVSGFAQPWGISLISEEDKKDDSVIMPLLREYRLPATDAIASAGEACEKLRASFFAAVAHLLEDKTHGR